MKRGKVSGFCIDGKCSHHSLRAEEMMAHFPAMEEIRICKRCGRTIEWRRKWQDVWESIQYCSDACRRARITAKDVELEGQILTFLAARANHASICPSEVARFVFPHDWQKQMEATRQAARRLVARQMVEITQGGRVIDPSTAKGPIRLRRGKMFSPT